MGLSGAYNPSNKADKNARISKTRSSTLTASERRAFDRILSGVGEKHDAALKEDDSLEDVDEVASHPFESLNSIFDAAIQDLKRQEEQHERGARQSRASYAVLPVKKVLQELGAVDRPKNLSLSTKSKFHKGFSRPLQLIDGKIIEQGIDSIEDLDAQISVACEQHREFIRNELESTSTDVEIWNVLEAEVFRMVTDLRQQMEREEKLLKDSSSKARRSTRARTRKPSDDENSPLKYSPTSRAHQSLSSILNESKQLSTSHLLSILQANYAHYNLLALRLWRRRHPTTPYALQLLPRIKSLGPISYVLGASAGLYNEVLFVCWSQYSDLRAIADVLQEMINQSVQANALTLEFLRFISRTRKRDIHGKRGKVLQSWWHLRGVEEGWAQVKDLYQQVKVGVDGEKADDIQSYVEKEGWVERLEKEEERESERREGEGKERRIRMQRVMSHNPYG